MNFFEKLFGIKQEKMFVMPQKPVSKQTDRLDKDVRFDLLSMLFKNEKFNK